jgi:hypothetical protein
MRAEMSEELGHAGRFIEPVLFLRQGASQQAPISFWSATRRADLGERDAITSSIHKAAQTRPMTMTSALLAEDIAIEEEGHVDWLTRQMSLLSKKRNRPTCLPRWKILRRLIESRFNVAREPIKKGQNHRWYYCRFHLLCDR